MSEMDVLKQTAEAEMAHGGRLQPVVTAFEAYGAQLRETLSNLRNAATHTSGKWTDAAGTAFQGTTDASVKVLSAKIEAFANQNLPTMYTALQSEITKTHENVLRNHTAYEAARNATPPDKEVMAQCLANARAALQMLGTWYNTAARAVTAAAGPGIPWIGVPPTGGGPAPAGAAPATTAEQAAPGGAPAGAAPGGAPAGGAAAGGEPQAGAGAGPSLAGASPSATLPPVPPSVTVPPVQPVGSLPPVIPSATVPTGGFARGGVGLGGTGRVGAVPGQLSIGKASAFMAEAALPPAGQAPQAPTSGGARTTGGTSGAIGGVPPMAPHMAGGAGGSGGVPKAGDAERQSKRTAKPPRTVPGVPPTLRGRAGMLDAKQAFLFPAGRPAGRDENGTVELIDEDLWQVDVPVEESGTVSSPVVGQPPGGGRAR